MYFVNAAAFFFFVRLARVEDHAVAGLDRRSEIQNYAIAHDFFDFAQKNPAFFAKARVDQFLVVDAAEPAGVKPARKGHFHLILRFSAGPRGFGPPVIRSQFVQRVPINPGDARDIFR